MAIEFTPQQELAINSKGAVLVSAAAGSGKTAVLVERVIRLMLHTQTPCDLENMLVVTFTNAAAAEMKERIGTRLAEELAKAPHNPRLLSQQMMLEKADISTIDAFCKRLISDHFEQLHLPPDFSLVSSDTLQLLKAKAMNQTLNRLLTQFPCEMKALAVALDVQSDMDRVKTAVELIYTYLRSLPFPELWLKGVREQYTAFTSIESSPYGQTLFARGEGLVEFALPLLEQNLLLCSRDEDMSKARLEQMEKGLKNLKNLQKALASKDWDGVVSLIAALPSLSYQACKMSKDCPAKTRSVTAQKAYTTALTKLQKLFPCSRSSANAGVKSAYPLVETLLCCTEEYATCLTQLKKEQNLLDFADLEYYALELLVTLQNGVPTPTPLGRELATRYQYVMVDEYQDANDLQNALYRVLSDEGKNLFTVGDIKQSIYRFRKANPANFLHLLETFPPYKQGNSKGTVVLDANFRSRPEICRTVNQFFAFVMSKEVGDITYDTTHHLNAQGTFAWASAPVTLEFLETDDRSTEELEADRIAQHIQSLVGTPCVTAMVENPQTGKKEPTLRNAEYKDFVILLRSHKKKGPLYVKRLQEHGIPAVADATDGFFEKREIRMVLSILTAIVRPMEDIPLFAALLSPLMGISVNQVTAWRVLDKQAPLYTCLQKAAKNGDTRAKDCLSLLSQLQLLAATRTPVAVLEALYHTHHLLAFTQLWERPEARKQNLIALLSLAEESASAGADRLDRFLAHLDALQEEEEAFAPECASSEPSAVRVMSIHHSKGLQFPLCFLAGCSGKKNNREATDPVVLDETLGIGISVVREEDGFKTTTLPRRAIATQNNRASCSEELRILYVAMTRAVDRLFLFDTRENLDGAIEKGAENLKGNLSLSHTLHPQLVLSAQNFGQLFLYFALCHQGGGCLRTAANTEEGFGTTNAKDLTVNKVYAHEIPLPQEEAWGQEEQEESPCDQINGQLLLQIEQALSYQNPFAPAEGIFAKQSVSALTHEDTAVFRVPRPAFLQEQGLTSAEKGTALHEFMQYANYAAASLNPRAEIERLVTLKFITPAQGEVIDTQKLKVFFESPLYARIKGAKAVWREHRFMAALPLPQVYPHLPKDFANEQTVTQGIVDCMFQEADGFVVVDYKTDKVKTPDELVARYQKQLQLYAKLLKESSHITVKELLIYSFSLNKEISVPLV